MRRSIAVVGLGLALAVLGFARPASAVFGIERVAATSPTNSSNKYAVATCPAGKKLTGTGGEVTGGGGEVVLDTLRPNPQLRSVTAVAREDETGAAASWSVSSYALCFSPPVRLVASSATDSSSPKSATATCPANRQVVGAGADIAGGSGQVAITGVVPNSALTSVTVTGAEDENGTAASWSVSAIAICAPGVPGLERVVATSATDSAAKSQSAGCPEGKSLTGAGGEITGGGGQVVLDEVSLATTSVTVTGFEDENGTAANWSIDAYAICAGPGALFGLQSSSASDSSPSKGVTRTCFGGAQVVGAGGDITGGGGQVVIDEITVSSDLGNVTVTASEDETGTDVAWSVTAYAICAGVPGAPELVAATSASNSAPKSQSATCPAGKGLTGTGGEVIGGGGQVVINDITPAPGNFETSTSVTVTGFEDENGRASDWSLRAFAICAVPPAGLFTQLDSSVTDSSSSKSVSIGCMGGGVVGVGGDITEAFGQVVIGGLVPNSTLTDVTATAFEDENGYGVNWALRSYAICAS